MTALFQDLRPAFRLLRRRPAFTATAVITLAIGMGVNAVAFSVVNGLLFKGFATAAAPGVGRIATTPAGIDPGFARHELLVADFDPASHGYSTDRAQRYADALLDSPSVC